MIGFNHIGRLGRLGNQMFQYSALKGIAVNRGFDFTIPNHKRKINDGIGNMVKTELFDMFNIKCNVGVLETSSYVSEKHFEFDEEIFNECPDNVSIHGFFQSEKYFEHIENEIREDFTFIDDVLEPCIEMIGGDNYNSIHVRRTDYLLNSNNHSNLTEEYYRSAIQNFSDDDNYIVFSDDPEWCKKQEIFSNDNFMISENTDNRIDLCLMTLCKGHIIANSSFSWWGAWLAKSDKVIAPKNWFGKNLNHNTKDLYPNKWIVI